MIDSIRRRRSGAVLASLGIAAGLFAGCGGDEEDTASTVNGICKDFNEKTKNLENVDPADPASFAAEAKKAQPAIDETQKELEGVEANEETVKKLGDDYTKFITNFAQTNEIFKQTTAAAESEDLETYEAGLAELERLNTEGDELAKKLKFNDCVSPA